MSRFSGIRRWMRMPRRHGRWWLIVDLPFHLDWRYQAWRNDGFTKLSDTIDLWRRQPASAEWTSSADTHGRPLLRINSQFAHGNCSALAVISAINTSTHEREEEDRRRIGGGERGRKSNRKRWRVVTVANRSNAIGAIFATTLKCVLWSMTLRRWRHRTSDKHSKLQRWDVIHFSSRCE